MAYIVVEGPIGVGKTVLTRLLGERLGMPTVFEQFESNPFLSDFYVDRERYAFQTEVFFLLNRYRQQDSVLKPAVEQGNLACDYMFAKTRLFAGMNLRGDELELFDQLYEALSERVARPDLVVYLRASLDNLMGRIYQRDRPFERRMERTYIERLSEVYDDFFRDYADTSLLVLDTDGLDLVRDGEAQQSTLHAIISAAGQPQTPENST